KGSGLFLEYFRFRIRICEPRIATSVVEGLLSQPEAPTASQARAFLSLAQQSEQYSKDNFSTNNDLLKDIVKNPPPLQPAQTAPTGSRIQIGVGVLLLFVGIIVNICVTLYPANSTAHSITPYYNLFKDTLQLLEKFALHRIIPAYQAWRARDNRVAPIDNPSSNTTNAQTTQCMYPWSGSTSDFFADYLCDNCHEGFLTQRQLDDHLGSECRTTRDLINWTKLRSTITALIWSPVEVMETQQRKIWRIKIGTHRERGTKQTTEQRPEKKSDLLNMDGNDVTRAVTYWTTT
ncbi:hypothetical protein PROFUN_17105, partial [Planoprotostelium fungivorum]